LDGLPNRIGVAAFDSRQVPDRDPGAVRQRFLGFSPFNSEVSNRFAERGSGVSSRHLADVLRDEFLRPELSALVLQDPTVRKAASEAIKRLAPNEIAAAAGLIKSFMDSPAFEEDTEAVLFALDDAEAVEVALSACERTLAMLSSPDAEVQRAGMVAREVSEVLTRAYVEARDSQEKERVLDVIDRSLEVGAYGAERALQEHDR